MDKVNLELKFVPENQVDSDFKSDMASVWQGDWYVDSEIGKLRKVLMRRPGAEIENLKGDPSELSLCGALDPPAIRAEFDELVKLYRANGIEVFMMDDEDVPGDCPNIMFCRDLVNGSPNGAIISRMGIKVRSPEVRAAAISLGKLGIPVAKTVNAAGTFEGACLIWIDRETALLGKGTRSNEAGVRQIEDELRNQGVKNLIRADLPHNEIHLDGMLGIADHKVVLLNTNICPEHIYLAFKNRGFNIVEVPPEEADCAINFVALEPGKIVMRKGCVKTKALLEAAGVECMEVYVDSIRVAGGAIHCLTAPLERDPVPVYGFAE